MSRAYRPEAYVIFEALQDLPWLKARAVKEAVMRRVKRMVFAEILRRVDFTWAAEIAIRNALRNRNPHWPKTGVHFDMHGCQVEQPDPEVEKRADMILALLHEFGVREYEFWSVVSEFDEFLRERLEALPVRKLIE